MGTYIIGEDELISKFEDFLIKQEGEVHAYVIAKWWNTLAKRLEWNDNLVAINKFTKKVIK